VLDVERWAELRREHFVHGVSIKELTRLAATTSGLEIVVGLQYRAR
jgi:hypothetical protein